MKRKVEKVELRADDVASAQQFAQALKEALARTTFAGDDRPGVVYIRKIELGTVSAGAGVDELARVLQAVIARALPHASWIGAPGVEGAELAWARERSEALIVLAERAARGLSVAAWPWGQILLRADRLRPAELVRRIHLELLAGKHPLASVVALVEALVRARVIGIFLEALEREDAVRALAILPPVLAKIPDRAPAVAAIAAESRWAPLVEFARVFGPDDPRVVWVAALALVVENRAHVADPLLTTRARAIAAELAGAVRGPPIVVDAGERSADRASPAHEVEGSAVAAKPAAGERDESPKRTQRDAASARNRGLREGLPTEFGGLYFAIAVLRRLGIERVLEENVELGQVDLARRILAALAGALEIAEDDAIRAPLLDPPLSNIPLPSRLVPPASWSELAIELGDVSLLEAWCAAVRAWIARWSDGELSLEDVIRRPATIQWTKTHLDVGFRLESADVRIRRLGLDTDPGWLPWFGRVIAFHYG